MKSKVFKILLLFLLLLPFLFLGNVSSDVTVSLRVPLSTFKFQVVYSAPGTFTLPILDGGAGYIQDFTVNWGDGTPDSVITSFDDPDAIHTYVGAGTYNVTMTGLCEWFAFNNDGDKTKITKLLAFTGDIGFKRLKFWGCSNLNTIVPLGTKASLTTCEEMFEGCSSIVSIPIGMFNGCIAATSFFAVFEFCTDLISIPAGLFAELTAVTTFQEAFYGDTSLIAIPDNLFYGCTAVISFESAFNLCSSLTTIGNSVFEGCTKALNLNGLFQSISTIETIGNRVFARCTSVTDSFNGLFYGQPLITIGNNVFEGCSSANSFEDTFANCAALITIGTDLFKGCVSVTTFREVFWNCTLLNSVLDGNIFLDCVLAEVFNSAFMGCSLLTGLGQPIIDNTALPGHTPPSDYSDCFTGCVGLTDYTTIPAAWGGGGT